jgi:hypothetical protein
MNDLCGEVCQVYGSQQGDAPASTSCCFGQVTGRIKLFGYIAQLLYLKSIAIINSYEIPLWMRTYGVVKVLEGPVLSISHIGPQAPVTDFILFYLWS